MPLIMVNVVNQRYVYAIQNAEAGREPFFVWDYLDQQFRDRHKQMKDLLKSSSPEMNDCHYIVQCGIPYRELLNTINKEEVGLLVLGTKGRSSSSDIVVGSTVRKMFRESPIPLITLPVGTYARG